MSTKEKLITKPVLARGPSFSPGDRANLLEVLQRARRMETRLTRLLESEGIQTGIQRPWLMDDRVMIPSPMTTIDAILKCIPQSLNGKEVQIVFKEDQDLLILCKIVI